MMKLCVEGNYKYITKSFFLSEWFKTTMKAKISIRTISLMTYTIDLMIDLTHFQYLQDPKDSVR